MLSKLRKKYYEWQDKKVYEKYLSDIGETSEKHDAQPQMKKWLIILAVTIAAIFIVILIGLIIKKDKDRVTTTETTRERSTTESPREITSVSPLHETTMKEETILLTFPESKMDYMPEITRKQTKKREPLTEPEITVVDSDVPTTEEITLRNPAEKTETKSVSEKQTEAPKQTKKKTVNNKVPVQRQSGGALGSKKTGLIKNTIMSNFAGTYDMNMQSLAIYMAENGLTGAQTTLDRLCDTSIKVTGKTATAITSGAQDDVLQAAEKLADKLHGSGTYGVGIRSVKSGGTYRITAVLVVRIN